MDTRILEKKLTMLRGEDGVAHRSAIQSMIGDILLDLLQAEGLQLLSPKDGGPDTGIDFAACRVSDQTKALTVAIIYKHYGQGKAAGVNVVRGALGVVTAGPFERALRGSAEKAPSSSSSTIGVLDEAG